MSPPDSILYIYISPPPPLISMMSVLANSDRLSSHMNEYVLVDLYTGDISCEISILSATQPFIGNQRNNSLDTGRNNSCHEEMFCFIYSFISCSAGCSGSQTCAHDSLIYTKGSGTTVLMRCSGLCIHLFHVVVPKLVYAVLSHKPWN